MSKRETDAVAAVLSSPENEDRTAEEVAELAIAALDDLRSRTHRLAVVGQIRWPQDTTHTVVLGPFSSRGIIDSPEKFLKAVTGGSAARTAGQDLAWDPRTRTGQGRFMLAPAFARSRDAWEFFRTEEHELPDVWRICKDPASYERIRKDVERWRPGLWDEELRQRGLGGPACVCGLRLRKDPCQVHGSRAA